MLKVTKLSDIKHDKHEVDATGIVLGQLASKVAGLLTGKSKPYFVRNMDCGDFVTVKNYKAVKITGKKMDKKIYTRYSGFPGGIRKTAMKDVNPLEVVRHAVAGMLPNNKLKDIWLARLKFE
ncbi:50S ribosomal protein L13 [Candidatus Microgenomates bacterium]|nr:50S ribosomal protein L13 [Candidatus Microgenomates bacterium]